MSIFESDLAALLVKASLLLVVAMLARVVLMRSSAATRHLALVMVLGALVLLPVLAVGLPVWQLEVLPAHESAPPVATPQAPIELEQTWHAENVTEPTKLAPATDAAEWTTAPANGGMQLSLTGWLLAVWAIGSILVLAKLVTGLLRMRWIARNGKRVTDAAALRLLDDCVNTLELRVRPLLIASEKAGVPLVWGWLRPALIVPCSFSGWSTERMRAVMLHELGHLKRNDWPVLLLGRVTAALYWFHPLAWLVEDCAKQDCERACDDIVVSYGTKPSEYASHLLSIARGVSETPASVRAALAVVRRSQLNSRLRSILNPLLSRNAPSRVVATSLGTALLLLLVPLASLQFAEQARADEQQEDSGVLLAQEWHERKEMDEHGEEHSAGAEAYKRAYKLHSRGRYEEARSAFEEALDLEYNPGASMYNIACCDALMGDADGAMRWFEKAMGAGFDDATNLVEDGDFDPIRADVGFQRFIDSTFEKAGIEREFPQHYPYRATMEKFQELKQTESTNGKDWHHVGYKMIGLREYEMAIEAFTVAAEHMGDESGTAMYNLACSSSLAGHQRQALSWLEQSVDAGFDQHERFLNDSDLDNIRESSEFKRIKDKSEFLSLGRFPQRDWEESNYSTERWAQAIDDYQGFVGDNPSNGRGWFNLGWALHHSERFDEAIGAFEKAVSLDFRTGTSTYNIACGHAKLNHTDAAIEALEVAVEPGRIGYGQLEHDDDLDSLRDDARFQEILDELQQQEKAEHAAAKEKKHRKMAEWKAKAEAGAKGKHKVKRDMHFGDHDDD